jgi:hypothetical protein
MEVISLLLLHVYVMDSATNNGNKGCQIDHKRTAI